MRNVERSPGTNWHVDDEIRRLFTLGGEPRAPWGTGDDDVAARVLTLVNIAAWAKKHHATEIARLEEEEVP